MKKLLTTILTLLLVAASLTAQISFGPRVGFNLTSMHESVGEHISLSGDFKPGFQIGIVADIAVLGKRLSVQPGLLFAQQGARFQMPIQDNIRLNYLQVPINLQLGFETGDNHRFLLQAGPYLGFALGGTRTRNARTVVVGSRDDEVRLFDFGVGFGIGVHVYRVQVGISYNLGIANISNVSRTTTTNNGFAFTVTFLLGNGR